MSADDDQGGDREDGAFNPALKANMAILRRRDGDYGRIRFAKRIGVGTGTIERALDGAGGVQLETLQKIAEYFGLEAWQLLVPDFGANLDWPFPNTNRESYFRLSPNLRGLVEGKLQTAIDEATAKANASA